MTDERQEQPEKEWDKTHFLATRPFLATALIGLGTSLEYAGVNAIPFITAPAAFGLLLAAFGGSIYFSKKV